MNFKMYSFHNGFLGLAAKETVGFSTLTTNSSNIAAVGRPGDGQDTRGRFTLREIFLS